MADGLRWMKFWPADWQRDPAVRMCSLAARGLWIEMICVMHEAQPYGHMLVNRRAPTVRQMAAMFGVPEREVSRLLAELEAAGVFSRSDDGTIYSRRMVRDQAVRVKARADGSRGGNPALRREADNHWDNHKENPTDNPEDNHGHTQGLTGGVNPPLKLQEAEAEAEEENPPSPPPPDGGGGDEPIAMAKEKTAHAKPPNWHGQWRGLRANGTNPRAAAAVQRAQPPPEPDHPLWPRCRGVIDPTEFRSWIAKCRDAGENEDGAVQLVAPSRLIRDRINAEYRLGLERALGKRVVIDVELAQ